MTNRKEKKNVELFELKCLYQLDSLVFAVFFASSESTQEELPDGYTLLKKKKDGFLSSLLGLFAVL